MVALEALALGRAVVVPDRGALCELVEPGRTGLRFASGDAASLAACCRELLRAPETCRVLGVNARASWEREYAPEHVLSRLGNVYRAALRSRAA